MAGQPYQTWTPVGRIVQGNPMVQRERKDKAGKPIIVDGKPATQYFMMLAFPKTDPAFAEIKRQFDAVAQRDFPQGEWRSPVFSNKITDGDGVDNKGRPNSGKEGFAGCWVLRVTSNFPYAAVDERGLPVTDPQKFKTGHYARVYINVSGNGQVGEKTPGLYANPSLVQWVAYGPEIVGGPDVDELLAQAPAIASLPAGASAAPLAAPGTPLGGQHAQPQGYVPPPAVGQQPPPPPPQAGSQQPPPPPPAQSAPWPPAGWWVYPHTPGSFYNAANEVLTEAQLRDRVRVAPHTQILAR